jgi:2-polyprenyl-6-methoxyphenol hydroxylase-like FAD-dependent oxidoreductase
MRTVIVGAGPVGTFTGLALSRRGHEVTLIDRDPGPPAYGEWNRRGVMQFNHPHGFRPHVRNAMLNVCPEGLDAVVAAGAVPARPDGFPEELTSLHCRRSTFEAAMWRYADRAGLRRITGHADTLLTCGDRVTGITVDGQTVEADLVLVATGRAGRFADDVRAPGVGGPCGSSYVSRMYRARSGVELAYTGMPFISEYDGFIAIAFMQDDDTLSALVIRQTDDEDLAELRDTRAYEGAVAMIPQLAPWTDPERFIPITDVMVGGALYNTYRGQRDTAGRVPYAGLVFIGDAVCTTNPAAGRGVTLGMRQSLALLELLDSEADLRAVAERFDDWCTDNVRPWFDDHVSWDRYLLGRMRGEALDLDAAALPSPVVCAAAAVEPSMMPWVGPYLGMLALPSILDGAQDAARAVLDTGWRPQWALGPTRDELVSAVFARA